MAEKEKGNVTQILRIILSSIYVILIILTVPLSFEVGGLNCGLNYTITILLLYFVLATLRIFKYHKIISTFLFYLQHLLLPSLLFLFLSIFNNKLAQEEERNLFSQIWVKLVVTSWKHFLVNSTPLFNMLEGFCSLLLIQSIGQTSKWLIRYKSDTWSIVNLLASGFIITCSLYSLLKIYISPVNYDNIGLISASLLGSVLTLTAVITSFALSTGRSSPLEASLMVAYVVKCIYEIFPKFQELNSQMMIKFITEEFRNLNQNILNLNNDLVSSFFFEKQSYSGFHYKFISESKLDFLKDTVPSFLWRFITENFPHSFQSLYDFWKISIENLTLPILINLIYRIGVFWAATKIIPILRPYKTSSAKRNEYHQKEELNTSEAATADGVKQSANHEKPSTALHVIYLYSPCIIISVYTNLMVQYNDSMIKENQLQMWFINNISKLLSLEKVDNFHIWQFWHWLNVFSVLFLYFNELMNHEGADGLTTFWNTT